MTNKGREKRDIDPIRQEKGKKKRREGSYYLII